MIRPRSLENFFRKALSKLYSFTMVPQRISHFDSRLQEMECEVALTSYCNASFPRSLESCRQENGRLRVGLAMNLANNMFHLANGLRAADIEADVLLFRETSFDNSLLGDPRWEIEEVSIKNFDQLNLNLLSSDLPPHVYEIENTCDEHSSSFPPLVDNLLVKIWPNIGKYLTRLQQYDILIVSGPAIAIAPFTGKPYITLPYGGDLMVYPFGEDHFSRLQTAGWRRASGHILAGSNFTRFAKILGMRNYTYLQIFIDTERYRPIDSGEFRRQLLAEHDCHNIFFMPSRHHWSIKCQDRVLRSIADLKASGRKGFKLLMTSWGEDLDRSSALIDELNLGDVCVFVPTMSKPILRKYLAASDLVIDQFSLGEYGTLTLEAMAMARPVMLYYKYDNAPPVLNAATREQISEGLEFALDNPQEMVKLGQRARKWVVSNHGAGVINKYKAALEATLAGEDIPAYPPFMT